MKLKLLGKLNGLVVKFDHLLLRAILILISLFLFQFKFFLNKTFGCQLHLNVFFGGMQL